MKLKNLTPNGKIFIFTIDAYKNEIPSFRLMKRKLYKSFERDNKILNWIIKFNKNVTKKKFIFKVKIAKKKYEKMIQNRYISTLLPLTKNELKIGLKEIKHKFKGDLSFNDKLICLILKKSFK